MSYYSNSSRVNAIASDIQYGVCAEKKGGYNGTECSVHKIRS